MQERASPRPINPLELVVDSQPEFQGLGNSDTIAHIRRALIEIRDQLINQQTENASEWLVQDAIGYLNSARNELIYRIERPEATPSLNLVRRFVQLHDVTTELLTELGHTPPQNTRQHLFERINGGHNQDIPYQTNVYTPAAEEAQQLSETQAELARLASSFNRSLERFFKLTYSEQEFSALALETELSNGEAGRVAFFSQRRLHKGQVATLLRQAETAPDQPPLKSAVIDFAHRFKTMLKKSNLRIASRHPSAAYLYVLKQKLIKICVQAEVMTDSLKSFKVSPNPVHLEHCYDELENINERLFEFSSEAFRGLADSGTASETD